VKDLFGVARGCLRNLEHRAVAEGSAVRAASRGASPSSRSPQTSPRKATSVRWDNSQESGKNAKPIS
jgi:hypothetical protein